MELLCKVCGGRHATGACTEEKSGGAGKEKELSPEEMQKAQEKVLSELRPEARKMAEKLMNIKIVDKPYLRHLEATYYTMKELGAKDYQELDKQLETINGEEAEKIREAVRILNLIKGFNTEDNQVGVLKRASRSLEELAVAKKIANEKLSGNTKKMFGHAINKLVDAVYEVASPQDKKNAGEALGHMDDEELKKKRDEIARTKVSG
jgi:hypothetical protein